MEFDLQRFDEDEVTATEDEEKSAEEKPIPEELNGLPEEYARETMAEWEQMQTPEEPEAEVEKPAEEPAVSREEYLAAIEEAKQLKAQLATIHRQSQNRQPQEQSQPQQPQPIFTAEVSAKINQAITAEAMALKTK